MHSLKLKPSCDQLKRGVTSTSWGIGLHLTRLIRNAAQEQLDAGFDKSRPVHAHTSKPAVHPPLKSFDALDEWHIPSFFLGFQYLSHALNQARECAVINAGVSRSLLTAS